MNPERFITAQQDTYRSALSELRAGWKYGHWMWYIFPQIEGLGHSSIARFYAIKSLDEATAYLAHPVLGSRLVECCEALLLHPTRTARDILGSPDDLKLRSCATLFAQVQPPHPVFESILSTFYPSGADLRTIEMLGIDQ
ncbi:MAG: calpastatin [Verrucomicrobiia bacterium Tous-C5FEB]|nr:MAG: calpastatin [Verrucomicrobiae bacterium Tous-C5FEB]